MQCTAHADGDVPFTADLLSSMCAARAGAAGAEALPAAGAAAGQSSNTPDSCVQDTALV